MDIVSRDTIQNSSSANILAPRPSTRRAKVKPDEVVTDNAVHVVCNTNLKDATARNAILNDENVELRKQLVDYGLTIKDLERRNGDIDDQLLTKNRLK
jgi:hypothetical protein